MDNIIAENSAELESVLKSIDVSVPSRTKGRTTEDCERWSICHLISTLNREDELDFPLNVIKRERPDFEITLGEQNWGVEITEAIPTDYARADALADSENPDGLIDMSLFKFGDRKSLDELRDIISQTKLTGNGWNGDSAEHELAEAIRSVVDTKTVKLIKLPIPAIPATDSGGSRPPVPIEAGHLNRSKAARYRSEATLVFNKSQIICFESN